MGIFSFSKKDASQYFSEAEKNTLLDAIRQAEQQTSGEIRLFVEQRCRFVSPVDRAAEVFFSLKMDKTAYRNGVLVYLAMKDRQFAVFADEGIYQAMGKDYWHQVAERLLHDFKGQVYATGLLTVIKNVGEALAEKFPYDATTDKNELPDDIVFGS